MSRPISCSPNSSACTNTNYEMASLRLVCRRRTRRDRLRPFPVQKLVHMLNIQFGVPEENEMTVARTCILDVMRTRQLMRKNPRVLSRDNKVVLARSDQHILLNRLQHRIRPWVCIPPQVGLDQIDDFRQAHERDELWFAVLASYASPASEDAIEPGFPFVVDDRWEERQCYCVRVRRVGEACSLDFCLWALEIAAQTRSEAQIKR